MTLTEFLLERIAEDEAPTFELTPYPCEPGCCAPAGWVGSRCVLCEDAPTFGGTVKAITEVAAEHAEQVHRRTHVLAECETKRRIVKEASGWAALCSPDDWPEGGMEGAPLSDAGRWILWQFALPFSDHPDYDEAWRP
jgi:hypothetical protein